MALQDDIKKFTLEINESKNNGQTLANLQKIEKETAALRKENEQLEKVMGYMASTGQKSTQTYKDMEVQLKANKATVADNNIAMKGLGKTLDLNYMSMTQLRKRAQELGSTLNSMSKAANPEDYARVEKELSKVNGSIGLLKKGSEETGGVLGNLGKKLEGVPGPAEGVVSGVKGIGSAFKALLANPVVLILGAIAGAFVLLKNAMGRTEEGQDKLNKVSSVFGSILNTAMNIISKVANVIVDDFEKPKETFKALGEFFESQVMNRIKSFGVMGSAIAKIFSKDWKEGLKDLGQGFVQLETGFDKVQQSKIVDGLKSMGNQFVDNAKKAAILADMEAKYRRDLRADEKEDAKITLESADLRARAEELKKNNADEAIKLQEKAFDLDESILKDEKRLLNQKLAIAKYKLQLDKDDAAARDEVASIEAEIDTKEAEYNEKKRERLRTLNKFKKESYKEENDRLKSALQVEITNSESIISQNDLVVNDDKKSLEERTAALNSNFILQKGLKEKNYDLDKALLKKELEIEFISQEDYDNAVNNLKASKNNEIEKLATETSQKQKDITNKSHADQLKDLETALKDKQAITKQDAVKNQLDQFTTNALLLADEAAYLQKKLAKQKEWGDDTKETEAAIKANVAAVLDNAAQGDADRLKQVADLKKKYLDKDLGNEEQKNIELANLDKLKKDGAIKSEEDYQKLKTAITKKYEANRASIVEKFLEEAGKIADMWMNLSNAKKAKELKQAGDDANKKAAIEKKYAKEQQKIAIGQALISGALAVLHIWDSTATGILPIDTILKGFETAVVVGNTIAQVATIKSQQFATGRYPVQGASDGRLYSAGFVGKPKTGIYNKASLGLFSERQPEAVIDGLTTERLIWNYPNIWNGITTLASGGIPQFASGKYPSGSSTGTDAMHVASVTTDPALLTVLAQNAELLAHLKANGVHTNINTREIFKSEEDYQNNIKTSQF